MSFCQLFAFEKAVYIMLFDWSGDQFYCKLASRWSADFKSHYVHARYQLLIHA